MSEEELTSRVVRLETVFLQTGEAIGEIKQGIAKIGALEVNLAKVLAGNEEQARSVGAQWTRIDNLKDRVDSLDKFKSRMSGAMWALGIVMTVLGGIATSAVLWLFATSNSSERINEVQQHRIETLEKWADRFRTSPKGE